MQWDFHHGLLAGRPLIGYPANEYVESWFSKLTNQRLRRGVFCSVQELVAAITDYLTHH